VNEGWATPTQRPANLYVLHTACRAHSDARSQRLRGANRAARVRLTSRLIPQELNGRLNPGTILGATGKRETKSMEALAKLRDEERKRKELKQAKRDKREVEEEWEMAQQEVHHGIVQHFLKPFGEMTGIECVATHAEPDEEEEVSDYDDEEAKPAPPKKTARDQQPRMTARQRVGMMMAKAQHEELQGSESEEEAEC